MTLKTTYLKHSEEKARTHLYTECDEAGNPLPANRTIFGGGQSYLKKEQLDANYPTKIRVDFTDVS